MVIQLSFMTKILGIENGGAITKDGGDLDVNGGC